MVAAFTACKTIVVNAADRLCGGRTLTVYGKHREKGLAFQAPAKEYLIGACDLSAFFRFQPVQQTQVVITGDVNVRIGAG